MPAAAGARAFSDIASSKRSGGTCVGIHQGEVDCTVDQATFLQTGVVVPMAFGMLADVLEHILMCFSFQR